MKRFIPIALILILLGLVLTPVVGYASEEDGAKTVVTVKPKPVSKPVKLIPTDDSYLGESSKDHNNGTKPFLAVRSYAQRDKRIIMQFQPKEVGSVALSPGKATLHLYVSGAKGTSVIEVRPFKSPGGKWEEKLVEWYGDGNQKWEYAGGTVSDPVIATFTVTSADVGKWIKVDLTPYTKALASGIPASLMLKMVNEDCQWEERYTHFKSKDTSTGRKPYITFE